MPGPDISAAPALFKRTLAECRELYVSSGRLCALEYPQLISPQGEKFVQLMDDLHRALVLKVYLAVCEADREWSPAEQVLAEILFEHLWNKHLQGQQLATAAHQASKESVKLKWYSLVRPFDQIALLREKIGELETIVMRLANIVARADGQLDPREAGAVKFILSELRAHLRRIPIDEPTKHEQINAAANDAIATLKKEATAVHAATQPQTASDQKQASAAQKLPSAKPAGPTLAEALAELDTLIGMAHIKEEVRTLTNYLKLQKRRTDAGLPDTDVTLHMVFTGNPGTGKTTIARIIGKIFGAMGILAKGHLVESDRAGLVAEYMGQTATKAHAKINEALDGVLFIDEAYSLVAKEGDDPFGHEAVQTLLKRAEDDRGRLVVILAGYPEEMQDLLLSNPGLSSRFNRTMNFADYAPLELAQIFGSLCDKNRYTFGEGSRAKLMVGLTELHRRRDHHFGNGLAVRNLFEQTIRRMANRIAHVETLTHEQLMQLDAEDVHFENIPPELLLSACDKTSRFRVSCPKCGHECKGPGSHLGKNVCCPKCQQEFVAEWGQIVDSPS